jgi:hypothetical protein
MKEAPLVFNLIALLIQTLPFLLISSSRFQILIPDLRLRLLLGVLYLLMPNTAELNANITNSQWFLALAACLVLIADRNNARPWRLLDLTLLLLAGLSGPFSILLTLVALCRWLHSREKQAWQNLIVMFVTATVQLMAIVSLSHAGRLQIIPEYTARSVLVILGRQVVLGALIGSNGYLWVLSHFPRHTLFIVIMTALVLLLVGYAFVKGPLQLKMLVVFAGLVLAASLVSPMVDFTAYPASKLLSESRDGIRYWLIPMAAVLASLVSGISRRNHRLATWLSGMVLATAIVGVVVDFRHPKFVDYEFRSRIEVFEGLARGQWISIPINPTGWTMELIKH